MMYRNGHVPKWTFLRTEIVHYDVPKLSSQNADVPKTTSIVQYTTLRHVPKVYCTTKWLEVNTVSTSCFPTLNHTVIVLDQKDTPTTSM